MIRKLTRTALQFAMVHHKGQLYGDQDFIVHPIEVARYLEGLGQSEEVISAGYLHDVLEDTQATYEQLEATFGDKVAELVREVTKTEYNTFPNLHSPEAVLILFVSRTCNLAHMRDNWDAERQEKYIQKSKFWLS